MLATLFAASLAACSPETPDKLAQIKQAGELIVATRNSATTYYRGPNGFRGLEYDMAQAFADHIGVKLVMVVPDHFEDVLQQVSSGEVHMAAAGLTITKERQITMRFAPAYQTIRQQVVYRQSTPRPKDVRDLIDQDIIVTAGTTYAARLAELKLKYPKLKWVEVKDKGTDELIQMVAEGKLSYTIADSNIVAASRPLYPELRVAFDLQKPEQLAWAFPLDEDNSLYLSATQFMDRHNRSGATKTLIDRYYGPASNTNYFNMSLYQLRIRDRLPLYRHLFETAGDQYGIDWRLLAALSYQESFWSPQATSYTGVQGMMMLTQATARDLGISDRQDPTESIDGGGRYLKKLMDELPPTIESPDRLWMALAAYNIGIGHLSDARTLTAKLGGNPDKWADVSARLPLLTQKKYYRHTVFGYARGHEPVNYVDRIRRYYDVLVNIDQKEKAQRHNYAIDIKAPAI